MAADVLRRDGGGKLLAARMSMPFDRQEDAERAQRQLRDLICLAVVGDHVRWVRHRRRGARRLAGEASGQWRLWADRVAHQLVAAGIAPDGRVRSLVKDLPLNWVPDGWLSGDDARRLIVERLALVAEWTRYRQLHAESADAEVLDFVATGLEAQLRARRQGATSDGNRNADVRPQRADGTPGGGR